MEYIVKIPATLTYRVYAEDASHALELSKEALRGEAYADLTKADIDAKRVSVKPTPMIAKKIDQLIKKTPKGNHGFEGRALRVWLKQREACVAALKLVKAGKRVPDNVALKIVNCPQMVTLAQDGQMRGGTRAGERWVEDVREVLEW